MYSSFESKFHDIKLVVTGSDEPNNGRMLWTADIYINGKLQTEKYFGSWNRLNWRLDSYVMDSIDGRYIFIPAESGGFLVDTATHEKISLPYKELSTIKFLKNDFTKDSLVITYTDEVVKIKLTELT
jgi:hypothetical protein